MSPLGLALFTLELAVCFGWPLLQMIIGAFFLPAGLLSALGDWGEPDGIRNLGGWLFALAIFLGGLVAFVGLQTAVRLILNPIVYTTRVGDAIRRIRWGLSSFSIIFAGLVSVSLYAWQLSPVLQFVPTLVGTLHVVYLLPHSVRSEVLFVHRRVDS